MPYTITTKAIQPQTTATIRVTVPTAEIGPTMGQIFGEIMAYLTASGNQSAGPPFSRYYDYGPDHVTMEVGFPVSKPIVPSGRIISGGLPGGEVAETWHIGPYETISQAYSALESWIKENGRESSGQPWEVYWTDPGAVPNPAEWRTEVIWPLK